uniref:Uncharacterized protein n=1 Tax=Nothobranchius furzeri TaxID=105023 RepID=A0A8C6NS22_NOTFU
MWGTVLARCRNERRSATAQYCPKCLICFKVLNLVRIDVILKCVRLILANFTLSSENCCLLNQMCSSESKSFCFREGESLVGFQLRFIRISFRKMRSVHPLHKPSLLVGHELPFNQSQ